MNEASGKPKHAETTAASARADDLSAERRGQEPNLPTPRFRQENVRVTPRPRTA